MDGAPDEWTLRAAWLPDTVPPARQTVESIRVGHTTCVVMESVQRRVPRAVLAARQLLGALARFAEYSGTGAQTTHGFGVTKLVSAR